MNKTTIFQIWMEKKYFQLIFNKKKFLFSLFFYFIYFFSLLNEFRGWKNKKKKNNRRKRDREIERV